MSGLARVGETYEMPVAPSGYPAAKGNRYLLYEEDQRLGVIVGRNLTDPDAVDIHGSPEAWAKAGRLVDRVATA